jgi:hypothetical protein
MIHYYRHKHEGMILALLQPCDVVAKKCYVQREEGD